MAVVDGVVRDHGVGASGDVHGRGSALIDDGSTQRSNRAVKLVAHHGFSEVARSDFDAFGRGLVEPRKLRRFEADRAEAASNLNRRVLKLRQVSSRSNVLSGITVNAALGRVDGSEERFLKEIAVEAVSRETDCAVRSAVELFDHLAESFDGGRHHIFVEDLHLRERHINIP